MSLEVTKQLMLFKEHHTCVRCGGTWVKTILKKWNGRSKCISGVSKCPSCSRSYKGLNDLPKKKDWIDEDYQLETVFVPEFTILVWDDKAV